MTLYQPELTLLLNADGDYFLHSTTYVPQINILTNGHNISGGLDSQNALQVELEAIQEQNLPADVNNITPVVHLVNLGNPFGAAGIEALNGSVDVTIYITDSVTAIRRPGGSSTIKNPSTSSDTRPNPNR